jgi:hypothetical protein
MLTTLKVLYEVRSGRMNIRGSPCFIDLTDYENVNNTVLYKILKNDHYEKCKNEISIDAYWCACARPCVFYFL